jgi:hypothetical protein
MCVVARLSVGRGVRFDGGDRLAEAESDRLRRPNHRAFSSSGRGAATQSVGTQAADRKLGPRDDS